MSDLYNTFVEGLKLDQMQQTVSSSVSNRVIILEATTKLGYPAFMQIVTAARRQQEIQRIELMSIVMCPTDDTLIIQIFDRAPHIASKLYFGDNDVYMENRDLTSRKVIFESKKYAYKYSYPFEEDWKWWVNHWTDDQLRPRHLDKVTEALKVIAQLYPEIVWLYTDTVTRYDPQICSRQPIPKSMLPIPSYQLNQLTVLDENGRSVLF